MLVKAGIAAVITLAVIGTAWEITFPPRPKILYNPTPSAPIGFYKISSKSMLKRGDKVAAFAPDWARKLADERGYLPLDYPLIKSVIAVHGDEVCYHKTSVSGPNGVVIDLLARDRLGRDMPRPSVGCITLKSGEYFIASPDVQTGFDSRYFGTITHEYILGRVKYLGDKRNDKINGSGGIWGFGG